MKVEKGKRVWVEAKLQVKGGEVIEESTVEYIQGSGRMLPALEKLLEGTQAGDIKVGLLAPKDAFGNEDLLPKKRIPRAEFPREARLVPGEVFVAKAAKGQDVSFRILAADGANVEVKLLHPLADKEISYKLKVVRVTDPAPPPLPGEAVLDDEG